MEGNLNGLPPGGILEGQRGEGVTGHIKVEMSLRKVNYARVDYPRFMCYASGIMPKIFLKYSMEGI